MLITDAAAGLSSVLALERWWIKKIAPSAKSIVITPKMIGFANRRIFDPEIFGVAFLTT